MEQTGAFRKHRLILIFFFLTGLTGLAYELVWIRLLILSFGSTQFAITTVLATFMARLALRSVIFGRVVDKYPSPLKVYGIIEIILGVYCVISPLIFYLVKTLYLYLSPIKPDAAFRADFEPMQFGLRPARASPRCRRRATKRSKGRSSGQTTCRESRPG